MINRLDPVLVLSVLVSAAGRTLPLALTVWVLTRDRWGLGSRAKAILWWILPASALLALGLPPLGRIPFPSLAATLLLLLWLAVALARLGGEVRRAIRLRRMVDGSVPLTESEAGLQLRLLGSEMGFDVPPRLCASAYVPTPVVLGILSPTVLVPEEFDARLTPEDLRMLLAHELAHVRRGDLILALVPALAGMLFAFHPLIGLAGREWVTEREAACDADAIAATGEPASRYAALLLKILSLDIAVPYRGGGLSPALGATANLHSLKRRLMLIRLTARRPSPITLGLSTLALLGALVLGAATPALANRLTPADPNLVKDGGFEAGDLAKNWTKDSLLGDAEAMGVSVTEDGTVVHSGKSSLRFDRTTKRYNPVLILNQDLPFEKGARRLKLGAWIKARAAGKATMAIWFHKRGDVQKIEWGAYVQDLNENKPLTHDWKPYDSVLEIPEGTDGVSISLQMYGPGTVWMDDVSAEYVSSETPLKPAIPEEDTATGSNLVKNGGFESDQLARSWEKGALLGDAEAMGVSAASDSQIAHSGKRSLRFDRTTQRYNPVLIMNQALPFKKGAQRIRIESWVKAQDAGKATIAVWFHKDGDVQKIEWGTYVQDLSGNGPLTHDWKKYESVLQVPEGTDGVSLSLQMYGPGTVWLDDVSAEFVSAETPLKPAISRQGSGS